MNLDLHQAESCICGKSYSQRGGLKKHQRFCNKSKKRLSGILGKAKELWVKRKRRRLEDLNECDVHGGQSTLGGTVVDLDSGGIAAMNMGIPIASEVCSIVSE